MQQKPFVIPELVVPDDLQWHHYMFRKLGIVADEYERVTFAFPPRKTRQVFMEIQKKKLEELNQNLQSNGLPPVQVNEKYQTSFDVAQDLAILDDEYLTETKLASSLYMRVQANKPYKFVIAYKYYPTGRFDDAGDEIVERRGRVLFEFPVDQNEKFQDETGRFVREWTDPGKRLSLEATLIFYPSIYRPRRGPVQKQISALHPSGKRTFLAKGRPNPGIGIPVRVRLVEKLSSIEAIPYDCLTRILSEEEMERLEVKALSTDTKKKVELPRGHVWDGDESTPVWESLNRHWAFLNKELEADVFHEYMSLEEFKQANRKLRGLLHTDGLDLRPAAIKSRNERAQNVGYFLDVMEQFIDDRDDSQTVTVVKGNGEAKTRPADPKPEAKSEPEPGPAKKAVKKKAAGKKATKKKAAKVTKPAQA